MSDDNNQYSGYSKEQKAKVADPKNQEFSMARAWQNVKSTFDSGNPQKDALARRKQRQEQGTTQADE